MKGVEGDCHKSLGIIWATTGKNRPVTSVTFLKGKVDFRCMFFMHKQLIALCSL